MLNPWIALYGLGIFPTLVLSSDEANSLTAEDLAELRALGLTGAMHSKLRALASISGRGLRLDFARRTVSLYEH